MGEIIKVGMADLNICSFPDSLTTLGLGSCVGIALYDKSTKVTGLAHIMLPDSTHIKNNSNKAKFADTGIDELLDRMIAKGARTSTIVAKIAGGAQMFTVSTGTNSFMYVGENNIRAVKQKLAQLRIPIVAEDVGLNYGRTIVIDSQDGKLKIRSVGKEEKYI